MGYSTNFEILEGVITKDPPPIYDIKTERNASGGLVDLMLKKR